jgi:superfamily II DNA/RNA helicase
MYGGLVYEMTFKEAIERNIISDYKVLTIGISDSQVRELVEKNRFLDPELGKLEEASAQNLASGIALKKAFKKHKIKHAISFHRSINLAKKFQQQQDELNAVLSLRPKVQNLHISSRKSSGERVELIKDFIQFDRSLLTNARCLTEGVDVPAIDCVMFVDPKQSVIDIVQASGRALRKFDGKEFGYILLPLVVPDEMDIEEFSETTAFRTITRIIAALSSQDERIIEEFKLEKHGRISSGRIINIDIDLKLGKKIDISKFSDSIHTKIWEKVAKVNYRSFEEAREYARGLGLKNHKEWLEYLKNSQFPYDIPSTPDSVYKNKGWESYGDFLGTRNISSAKREFRPFKEAREYIRSLAFKNSQEWREFTKSDERPEDIPTNPHTVYDKEEWIGIPDWIGNKNRNRNIPYTSFEEAKNYARTLNLKTQSEWLEHTRTPDFPIEIHKAPHKYYKNKGWKNLGDFLGTGYIATSQRKYRSFKEAREYARNLNFKSREEWIKHTKTPGFPDDIPVGIERAYKDEWTSMGDFLGSSIVATFLREYRSFEEARKYARSLNLKNEKDWRKHNKTAGFPNDIPHNPLGFYKEEWVGMGDWLGNGQRNRNIPYKPFEEARKYARSLNLKSNSEWVKHTKTFGFPENTPKDPRVIYKNKGWKGMGDWLGNK